MTGVHVMGTALSNIAKINASKSFNQTKITIMIILKCEQLQPNYVFNNNPGNKKYYNSNKNQKNYFLIK